MVSPFLYFAGARLTQAELSAACLDGHLVGLGDGYIPADVVETALLRAASLAELLGDTLAVTHESAAWVFGHLAQSPARHTVQRAVDRRLNHVVSRRLIYRDPYIAPEDLLRLADVPVTTPARTLADLARSTHASSHELARDWARSAPADARAADVWLDARTVPRKRSARMLLAEATTT